MPASRLRRRALLAATALLALAAAPALAKGPRYAATITRTTQGIPHIRARDMAGLGYGSGYTAAEDNGCVIAETIVTVRGERSRWFGSQAKVNVGFSEIANLESDFYHRVVGELPRLETGYRATSADNRALLTGFVAGYNKYLRDHPEGFAASCRGAAWLRAMDHDDLLLLVNSAMTQASSAPLAGLVSAAQPPAPAAAMLESTGIHLPQAPAEAQLGSNGWAFGGDKTANGRGLVIGNPHFPWKGPNRFRRLHLTIPGKLDVMGAGLVFSPFVAIGFTKDVAWTHTVTTAQHFTLYELQLDPKDPTAYLLDGKSVPMIRTQVTVAVKDGAPVTRTLYSTRYGPAVAGPAAGLIWNAKRGYALRDADQANQRSGDAWLGIARARTVAQIRDAIGGTLGIPYVNTIAADRSGDALYADVTAVPNVSAAKWEACVTPAGRTPMARDNGVTILDGARSACDWDVDPAAPVPGLMPIRDMAVLTRRDYVQNSNDSYWLSNPHAPFAAHSPLLGPWGTRQNLRTRSGIAEIEAATARAKMEIPLAEATILANKVLAAELVLPRLLELCATRPALAEPCGILAKWDRRADTASRGALLFFGFWRKAGAVKDLWTTPFDPARPLDTPAGLNPAAAPAILDALQAAADDLRKAGTPLDAPLGTVQVAPRGTERIAIHGGPGPAGILNAMASAPAPEGLIPFHGSSYMQAVSLGTQGPAAESMLSYSQSTNPESPHYADGTHAFSEKRWLKLPFTAAEIAAAREGAVVVIEE
ncbi:MAG: penicillin acylase family protein [Pseudomonadota bacterium]